MYTVTVKLISLLNSRRGKIENRVNVNDVTEYYQPFIDSFLKTDFDYSDVEMFRQALYNFSIYLRDNNLLSSSDYQVVIKWIQDTFRDYDYNTGNTNEDLKGIYWLVRNFGNYHLITDYDSTKLAPSDFSTAIFNLIHALRDLATEDMKYVFMNEIKKATNAILSKIGEDRYIKIANESLEANMDICKYLGFYRPGEEKDFIQACLALGSMVQPSTDISQAVLSYEEIQKVRKRFIETSLF